MQMVQDKNYTIVG